MKRLALLLTSILTIFALNACKAIDSEEETSEEAYICIGAESARTIMPSIDIEKMHRFSLYGKKNAGDSENYLMGFSTFEDLLAGKLSIKSGTWYEFKLTASNEDGLDLIGTISNKEIVQGKNTLNFTLALDESQNYDSGYIDVTFKIPSTTAVKAVKACLYEIDSDEPYQNMDKQNLSIIVEDDHATAKFNNGGYFVTKGTYRLKAWFYADEECTLLVSTFNELVRVVGSTTSKAEREIEKFNAVYTITLNGEGSYREKYDSAESRFYTYIPKTFYNRYDTENIVLPTADEMYKTNHTFLGWYTTDDENGELVTEIDVSKTEDVVVYAKWFNGLLVTAEESPLDKSKFSYFDDGYTIQLKGEWSIDALQTLLSSIKNCISGKNSITFDMSEVTGITEFPDGEYKRESTYSSNYISTGVFSDCGMISSIKFPASLTKIGAYTFYKCDSLQEVVIPESVTEIGHNAFSYCESLVTVKLPDELISTSLSFSNCSSLKNVNLPKNLTYVNFTGCTSLAGVDLPNSITSVDFTGCASLESVDLPNGIYGCHFDGCTTLSEIEIPESVRYIGENGFRNCSSLTSITIPNNVTSIESGTFKGCSSLESVTIPNSITTIRSSAFHSCSSLKSVTIPNSITTIEVYAFSGCSSLESITIPSSVTRIKSAAFSGCTALKSITIPNNVTSIGDGAFSGCSSMESIIIPNGVTDIKYQVFAGCTSLESVTIPNSVTSIELGAFMDCITLKTITIPTSVKTIEGCAFQGCTALKSITIPNSVQTIEIYTFYGCSSLESVTIPNSVHKIESWAFLNCSALASITIPSSVTSIKYEAFSGCTALKSITIPNRITSIENKTFYGCTALTSITIPASVKRIGKESFADSGLTSVTFEESSIWYRTTDSSYSGGDSFTVMNYTTTQYTSQNARFLTLYKDYYLYRN